MLNRGFLVVAAVLAATLFAPVAAAQVTCLDTLYARNNGGSNGGAVYFDLTVNLASGITVTTLNTNTSDLATFDLTVYTCPGTYAGNEANPGVWTQVAMGTATGQGANVPTPVDVSDFNLTAGTVGVALVMSAAAGHDYTNGNGANQSYSDANIALSLGSASNVPFSGSPFNPRVWNGAVCYQPLSSPPTCTLTSPPPLVNGDATIGLDANSTAAATVDVLFEFSLDGGVTYNTCTAAAASPLTNPALGVPIGPATFEWDTRADGVGLLVVDPGVLVQATVDDGVVPTTGNCVTTPFDVDNSMFCNLLCGDCDENGIGPDILDALLAAQIGALIATPVGQQIPCCDVNDSGAIDVLDALVMAQFAALLPATLVCP